MSTWINYPGYIAPSMVQGGSPMVLDSPPTPPDIAPPSGPTCDLPPYTTEIGPSITQVLTPPPVATGTALPTGPSGNLPQYTTEIGSNITQVISDNPTVLDANGTGVSGPTS